MITNFLREEKGQDLTEYALLLAFVCLASAGLLIGSQGSISGIWSTTSLHLSVANTTAS